MRSGGCNGRALNAQQPETTRATNLKTKKCATGGVRYEFRPIPVLLVSALNGLSSPCADSGEGAHRTPDRFRNNIELNRNIPADPRPKRTVRDIGADARASVRNVHADALNVHADALN
eukprot:6176968-Pyramimonas_sp.AAC.1